MNDIVVCSVKEACELIEHMSEDDIVILTIFNRRTYLHNKSKKIQKKKGEELIRQADDIYYQDNDIFGRLSLYGVLKEQDIVHNILFPQLE